MKKSILLALTAILLAPSQVLAISDENITKRRPDSPAKIEVQEIRQDRIEERKENREEVKTNMQERRSNIAENHATRLEKRFAAYFTRLNNIISRFQTRLDLLKKEGKDIAQAQAKLEGAKTKLGAAKTAGEQAVIAFRAIDPTKFDEQKAKALAARDQANAARKLFADAHNQLKEALKSLQAISKPALPAASPAVQNAL